VQSVPICSIKYITKLDDNQGWINRGANWWEWPYKRGLLYSVGLINRGANWWEWPYKRGLLYSVGLINRGANW
jgi:hypothetical protein